MKKNISNRLIIKTGIKIYEQITGNKSYVLIPNLKKNNIEINNNINNFLEKVSELKRLTKKLEILNDYASSPRMNLYENYLCVYEKEIFNCINSLSTIKPLITNSRERLIKSKKQSINNIVLRNIIEDLIILNKENKIKEIANNKIVFKTKEIVLEDENKQEHKFGSFNIIFDISRMGVSRFFSVSSDNPYNCLIPVYKKYIHPHVGSDGHICEGEAAEWIDKCIREYRFLDLIQIIENLLGTYNQKSPYIHLKNWLKNKCCHFCNTAGFENEMMSCSQCNKTSCSSCFKRCVECNEKICPCSTLRCSCGRTICKKCVKKCSCGYIKCKFCSSKIKICECCNETYCNACDNSFKCSCGKEIKSAHLMRCKCSVLVCCSCRKMDGNKAFCLSCHEALLKGRQEQEELKRKEAEIKKQKEKEIEEWKQQEMLALTKELAEKLEREFWDEPQNTREENTRGNE